MHWDCSQVIGAVKLEAKRRMEVWLYSYLDFRVNICLASLLGWVFFTKVVCVVIIVFTDSNPLNLFMLIQIYEHLILNLHTNFRFPSSSGLSLVSHQIIIIIWCQTIVLERKIFQQCFHLFLYVLLKHFNAFV